MCCNRPMLVSVEADVSPLPAAATSAAASGWGSPWGGGWSNSQARASASAGGLAAAGYAAAVGCCSSILASASRHVPVLLSLAHRKKVC
jgi:hypothetical protein